MEEIQHEEKSSKSSSFEDLSNLKDEDLRPSPEGEEEDDVIDVVGNKQLLKKTLIKGTDDSRPERTFVCKVTIQGCLQDGGKVIEDLKNVTIQLGDYEVVQGKSYCYLMFMNFFFHFRIHRP